MRLIVVPGYNHLFGESSSTYRELMKDVPSDIVIRLIIALNNELNTPESHSEKQKRLIDLISYRYTKEQITFLDNAFLNFKKKVPHYEGTVFGRRYLLSMLLDELKRNNKCDSDIRDPIHEYNFLIGYLMATDEVSEKDARLLKKIKESEKDELSQLKIIWTGLINQYEFNHNVNVAFELFRLVCFLVYSYENYKPFLKELVNKNGFYSLAEFINSFYQLVNSTLNINPNEPLQKLSYISPTAGADSTHLKNQSINKLFGKENLSISDIKKYPLYETDRGFMIIDEDMYRKKLYRGPLFELRSETGLRKMPFEDYKSKISRDVYERRFFQSIANSLRTSKYEIIKLDDNKQGVPDLYLRSNKKVILIEFKDYLFPDAIVDGEDFNLMKNYIDERFISSDAEQKKGTSQLINHLRNLDQYAFDPGLKELLKNCKRVKVYPVICYTDFMFSVSGINEYLDITFSRMVKNNDFGSYIVKQVTLVSLEVLFDFSLRGGDYLKLIGLIDRYWNIIENRVTAFKKQGSMQMFLSSKVSFDEIYESIFKRELLQNPIKNQIDKSDIISSGSGITQEILEEIL